MKAKVIKIVLLLAVVLGMNVSANAFGFKKLKNMVSKSTNVISGDSGSSNSLPDDTGLINAYLRTIAARQNALYDYEVALGIKNMKNAKRAELNCTQGGGITSEELGEAAGFGLKTIHKQEELKNRVARLDENQKIKLRGAISKFEQSLASEHEKREELAKFIIKCIQNVATSGMSLGKGIEGAKRVKKYKAYAKVMDNSKIACECKRAEVESVTVLLNNKDFSKSDIAANNYMKDDFDSEDSEEDMTGDTEPSAVGANVDSVQLGIVEDDSSATGSVSAGSMQLGLVEDDATAGKDPEFVKGYNEGVEDKAKGTKRIDPDWSAQFMIGYEDGYRSGK